MFVGAIEFDLLLGDVRSLKQKRAVIRPLLHGLRKRFDISVAEVGGQDLRRRALVGAGVVAADPGRCADVLDQCERYVAERPEVELLSAHRRLFGMDD